MQPLWQLSATEQAIGISSGAFTSADVMDSVLARIAIADKDVNAIADINPEAARQAAAAADIAVSRGDPLGPLHGVPFTVKVNVDVSGLSTNNGVPAFQKIIATDNSPVVQNLVNAGAVIAGRTNTPEF
ncbi:MAG TPA: amidase, partial [Gammaproteobacteria bacterium]|nr:amidase [Gammaproteobacteria bacterium]